MEEPRTYPTRPFVGVGVVILKDDHVLLIRRGKPPRKGEWSLPGGSQNIGETVRDTARREAMEETGVTIDEPVLIDVIDAIIPDAEGRVEFHYTLIDFVARWRSGTPAAGDDADHVEWIPLSAIEDLEIWETTKKIVARAADILD